MLRPLKILQCKALDKPIKAKELARSRKREGGRMLTLYMPASILELSNGQARHTDLNKNRF